VTVPLKDVLKTFDRAMLEHLGVVGWLHPHFSDASLCPTTGGVYVVSYSGAHPATFPDNRVAYCSEGGNRLKSLRSDWQNSALSRRMAGRKR